MNNKFFNLINVKQIKKSCYEYLLSLCDKVTFLYNNYQGNVTFEQAISSCGYSDILKDLISSSYDTSWGMAGMHYTFTLSDNVKKLITEMELDGTYYIKNDQLLENLTLTKNDKVLYTVCSHEGYEDIDENFSELVSNFCLKEIQKTHVFKTLLKNYKNLGKTDLKCLSKYLTILFFIDHYIKDECNYSIRQVPPYKITYKKFLNISKKIFTKRVFNKLNKASCFKDLHPDPSSVIQYVPKNVNEIPMEKYRNQKHFSNSSLHKEINTQLYLFECVTFTQTKKLIKTRNTPISLIINEQK